MNSLHWTTGISEIAFYFTELAAYVHNQLAPDLLTAVIVPNQSGQSFGSLFQINSAADEIFISGATVDDVSIITALRSQPTGGFRYSGYIYINCHNKHHNRISSVRLYYNRFGIKFKFRQ